MPDTPATESWGFHLDGRFTDQGNHNRALTAFVRELVMLRRTTRESPADLAARIRAEGHEGAFGLLRTWDALTGFHLWPGAPSGTSAGETVKRAGYAQGSWSDDGGSWSPLRDSRG